MACLNLSTNVNLEGMDTASILSEATSSLAEVLPQPENFVMVVLKGSVPVSFGGTQEPSAFGKLITIAELNPDTTTKRVSAAIASVLETKLSVPKNRFYIRMSEVQKPFFGFNGTA